MHFWFISREIQALDGFNFIQIFKQDDLTKPLSLLCELSEVERSERVVELVVFLEIPFQI